MTDTRPPFDCALDAFAGDVDAVVTPPGGEAVEMQAFWLPSSTAHVPVGADYHRSEQRRVLVLPREGLPAVPRGTIVTVPEYPGADPSDWRVDATEHDDFDHRRVVVIPEPA